MGHQVSEKHKICYKIYNKKKIEIKTCADYIYPPYDNAYKSQKEPGNFDEILLAKAYLEKQLKA